jgi:hypothetical protein
MTNRHLYIAGGGGRKSITLLKGSQASPACPGSSTETKMPEEKGEHV